MEMLNRYYQSLINFAKKINRIYFLVFICIIITISGLLRLFTPPVAQKELLVQKDSLKQQGTKITFASLKLEIPKEMSILQSTTNAQSVKDYTEKLAHTLNYTSVNRSSNVWVNDEGTSSLSVEEINNTVLFKNFFTPFELEEIAPTVSQEQAKNIFTQFLDTRVLLKDYSITQETPVVVDSESITSASEVTANAFQFDASQIVEGVPFVVGTRRSALASGIVLRNGGVMEINFYPEARSFTKVFSQKTLSLDQVQRNAQNGTITYLLVSATSVDNNETTTNKLKEVFFDSAVLEYRENEENGYIVPYVHFKGLGKGQNNQEYAVEAISPAVKVE